ncbi:collagen-binding domain-containing protein [Micromonospora fluostatini]|uniref:collagen-binding domain-containing protein n=1 Tax=Micromonospora sp. JCM 30529 TaxID=3421643 RepID=UPI003D17316E
MRLSRSIPWARILVPVAVATTAALVPLAVTGSGATPRQAVNPVAPTQGFLVMTEGDANLVASENEGTVAVGGDLSFGNYQIALLDPGTFVVPPDTNPTALVVGGRIDFAGSVPGSRLSVLNGGYVKVGDLTGTVVRDTDNNGAEVATRLLPTDDYDATPRVQLTVRQPVASVGPASPLDFAGAFAAFRATSTDLAGCAQNVVLRTPEGTVVPRPIPPGTNAVVTLTPGVTNVLNLSATDLANIAVLTFADQPTADTPLLVNVDTSDVGDEFVWRAPNFAGIGGEPARYILFNFPTATSITLTPDSATIEGTLYAPNADLTAATQSNIEGSVISRTLDHNGGEIHDFPFDTVLDCGQPTPTPTTPTPSPSTPTPSPSTPTPTPSTPTPQPSGSTPPPPTPSTSPPYPPHGPKKPHLPVTGAPTLPLLGAGAALLGVGTVLLLAAANRRRPGTGRG